MKFGDMLSFRKDLFFEGAVQADWFYQPEKAALVAENFVFHGSEYYGVGDNTEGQKYTDTVSFAKMLAHKANDDEPGNPLTLAIAGYGMGKSHLAVALATLLSGNTYQPEAYLSIIKNIRSIDSKAAAEIRDCTQKPNLVLVLNGMRDFNLHYELLRAAQKSLKIYGCDDSNLRKLNRAIDTAFRFFERNAESMQGAFESFAGKYGYLEKGSALMDKIRRNLGEDESAFNIINAVYEDVNAHPIRWDEGITATAVLEALMSEYCGISGPFSKVIIIFDEFGRYLEYASSTNTAQSGDSALQQIFECAQNFGGDLQVVNFIQADIKAFLQRVDQSLNISRYIGRYDASEKFRLSSNLETIFANLIQRTDKDMFESVVISWQDKREATWREAFDALNRWLPTNGVWKDYALFRKVAVEGIYPLHPLSTYMLTGLSDYLQNRSSLMLLSRYIDDLSNTEVREDAVPLVMPEALLQGDLFTEMLAAEEDGRQVSQHCIRYNNVLRKYGDKLSEKSKMILRANLALRILRCRTKDYDDTLLGLEIFSGLDEEDVRGELIWLENEYAVIGYDEHAACFDFLEESSGAHDFKTLFRRLRTATKFTETVFSDLRIRELSGTDQPQDTDFALKHKISTNEWQFVQDLFPIGDLSTAYIQQCRSQWSTSISIDKPKGQLIWLYSDNGTSEEILEKAQKYAAMVADTPIVLMLLQDSDGLLKSALCDYLTLLAMPEADQNKYGRHYQDKLDQTENNIRQSFENLRKERLHISEKEIAPLPGRIKPALTGIFETLYPKAVPFDFDGFASKQPAKARKAFCSIVRLLLSGQVNESTVHAFTSEIRNRFEATLFANNAASWRVVNAQYQITPPMNKAAAEAYHAIIDPLPEGGSISLGDVISMLALPPYGMSDYGAVYMISSVLASMSFCLRLEYKKQSYTIGKWKDLVITDSKIELNAIRDTILHRINAGAVSDQFMALFNRINGNTDYAMVEGLEKELSSLLAAENIPDGLEAQLQLARNKLQEGRKIQRNWDHMMDDTLKLYDKLLERQDFYSGLQCMQELKSHKFYTVFQDTGYLMSEDQAQSLKNRYEEIRHYISPYLMGWISQQRCSGVDKINAFGGFMKKLCQMLEELGYAKEARIAKDVSEKELSNIERIRERESLKRNCVTFNTEGSITETTPYIRLLELKTEGEALAAGIAKFEEALGKKAAEDMLNNVSLRLERIKARIDEIKGKMDAVYDALYEISSVNEIRQLIADISRLKFLGIPDGDMEDYLELETALNNVLTDLDTLIEEQGNRTRFEENYAQLCAKYEEAETDFDVLGVLEGLADTVRAELDRKDHEWAEKYLKDIPEDLTKIYAWQQDTAALPVYLGKESVSTYRKLYEVAEKKLSKAKVNDILMRFDNLSKEEQKKCLEKLKERKK